MEFKEVKEIIDYVYLRHISKFQLEIDGVKIFIENGNQYKCSDEKIGLNQNKIVDDNIKLIMSPMVGACHISNRGDGNKKEKGDFVEVGEVICVVEAMKIFHEIKSDYKGEIEEVLFHDGDLVEYNKPLFKIKVL